MLEHTHTLHTFWKGTLSQASLKENITTHSLSEHILTHCQPIKFGRKSWNTLTSWTRFRRTLSAGPVLTEIYKTDSPTAHILRVHCQPVQFEIPVHTHFLDTFWEGTISWSSLTGNSKTDLHPEHILRALLASPVGQKVHTHMLDTFWEGIVSQSSIAGNSRTHSHAGHILRGQC